MQPTQINFLPPYSYPSWIEQLIINFQKPLNQPMYYLNYTIPNTIIDIEVNIIHFEKD